MKARQRGLLWLCVALAPAACAVRTERARPRHPVYVERREVIIENHHHHHRHDDDWHH